MPLFFQGTLESFVQQALPNPRFFSPQLPVLLGDMLNNLLKRALNLDGNDDCAIVAPSEPKKRASGVKKVAKKIVKPAVKKEEDEEKDDMCQELVK
jgi:hypothetical protein